MAIKVIGAGGPRTGTASLKTALEVLGFGKCSHMEGLFNQPDLVDYWVEFFETGKTDFDALFKDHQSTTDFPGCLLYKELLEQYPDAKVILTLRDPENWYQSTLETVHRFVPQTFMQKLPFIPRKLSSPRFRNIAKTLALVEVYFLKRHYKGQFKNKKQTLEIYNAFNEEVRRTVPKGQLLEMHISEGWEPICKFLNVPIPDQPFPKKNQRAQFIQQIGGMINGGGKLQLK